MKKYNFSKIERKWQGKWFKDKIYEPDLNKSAKPFYNLMMFPYPSAEGLHVGNVYAFVGSDIYGRFKRMQGQDVFQPIGLDGFGIHSENYAMKVGAHPANQAKISEKRFYKQLESIGNGFSWESWLETYDPEYYKWTQWIFTEMFRRGLAYRKSQPVNWCPKDKTVLADEQVISGKCERCGADVIQKELEQWFFRITKYADRLLKNLETIDWSEKVKIAQKNWIGKSEGASIKFKVESSKLKVKEIEVFTTRPDTIFGATFIVISPEHPLLKNNELGIKNYDEVKKYVARAENTGLMYKTDAGEKTGVELKGVKVINPATQSEIPVWVADYVLSSYGTGAIMAVPAHDVRDFEFAKKFKLPIREVIEPLIVRRHGIDALKPNMPFSERRAVVCIIKHWKEEKYLGVKWGNTGWQGFVIGGVEDGEDPSRAGLREIIEETGYQNPEFVQNLGGTVHAQFFQNIKNENRFAHFTPIFFQLRDGEAKETSEEEKALHKFSWLTPEEMKSFITHDDMRIIWSRVNGNHAYEGEGLLINSGKFDGLNSEEEKWKITELAQGIKKTQFRLRDWLISRQRYWGPPIPMIYCASCAKSGLGEQKDMPGWFAVPEKDLPVKLPNLKNFHPAGTGKSPLATSESFIKVRCPSCKSWARRESDVSDTFLDSAWYHLAYLMRGSSPPGRQAGNFQLPISKYEEVFKNWLPVEMYIGGAEHSVLHLLYSRFIAMMFHDLGMLNFEEPFIKFRAHGLVIKDGAKMSKSKGNVVSPDEYIKKFGADTLRMALMFLAPLEQAEIDFRDSAILGVERFLERAWKLYNQKLTTKNSKQQKENKSVQTLLHKSIKKITEDIEDLQYNTAISALMVLLNGLEKQSSLSRSTLTIFLKLLAPFAPHITEEIWSRFFAGEESRILDSRSESGCQLKTYKSIHKEAWPEYDSRLIKEDEFDLVIQINGKHRDTLKLSIDAGEEEAKNLALSSKKIKEFLGDKSPRKIIYVKNRLINFVV